MEGVGAVAEVEAFAVFGVKDLVEDHPLGRAGLMGHLFELQGLL